MSSITLESLVGKHTLSGVDMFDVPPGKDDYESANAIRFTLDGVTYVAVEDPDDGYRSMLDRVELSDTPTTNAFPGCLVLASMDADTNNDTLELRDVKNGKVVLRVGTDQAHDYYPWFVAEWTPENMAQNAEAK